MFHFPACDKGQASSSGIASKKLAHDFECGKQGVLLAKLQHPPVAGKTSQQVQTLDQIIELLGRQVPILALFMVNMRVEHTVMVGQNEVFKGVVLTLHRRAHPGMANIQCDARSRFAHQFLKQIWAARPPASQVLQAHAHTKRVCVAHQVGKRRHTVLPREVQAGIAPQSHMDRHEAAVHLGNQPARAAKNLRGGIGFCGIGIAQIDPLEGAVVTNLNRMQSGDSLDEPQFIDIIGWQVLQLERPVHAGKPVRQGCVPELFHIRYEIA